MPMDSAPIRPLGRRAARRTVERELGQPADRNADSAFLPLDTARAAARSTHRLLGRRLVDSPRSIRLRPSVADLRRWPRRADTCEVISTCQAPAMPHSAAADERNGRRPARRSDRRADRPPPGSRRDRIEPRQGVRQVALGGPARRRQDRSRCTASRPRRPARRRQDGSGCTASGHGRPGTVPPGRARRGILRSPARCRQDGSRCAASRPRRPGTAPTGWERVRGEWRWAARHGGDRTAAGARRVAREPPAQCRQDGRGCAASGHRRPGTVPPGRARRGILRSLARCRRDGSGWAS
ncbi:hypothetical protein SAMN04244553_4511 [Nocardia amikacinitolerans]|uniref:Uncharacterized protein n=1 Tax=Nocardia amikacinitolerans TaxID=756689 RepID=A0A285LSZ1_9NOCA|nr:hypothetical protein SAMN04244553_4511 [Nocardia amikacinitolerans]